MMKINLLIGIGVIFAASCISVRAEDNPAQAAARAALIKMLMDSTPQATPAQTNPPPLVVPPAPVSAPVSSNLPESNGTKVRGKSSWDVGDSTFTQTNAAPAAVLAPVTAPVATAAMPVPVAATPVTVNAPAPVAPVKTQRPPVPTAGVVKQPVAPAPVKTGTDIVTIYGTVYRNAEVEKIDPDGLIISYSTAGGGLGMTKVEFRDLPYTIRAQYHRP